MAKKILSVITARAGSKGIINKNTKILAGKPLFLWSVLASQQSEYINLTIVSSNCSIVKEELEKYNNFVSDAFDFAPVFKNQAIFLQRPEEISGDLSKNEEALIHAYEYCKNELDFDADIIVNLQPTSPIRNKKLIDACIKKFINDKADSLFTGSKHTPFFFRIKNKKVIADWDIFNRPMRQKIKEFLWHDDGSVYIMKKELLLNTNCRLGGKMSIFETDKYQSLQIDTIEDFNIIDKLVESGVTTLL